MLETLLASHIDMRTLQRDTERLLNWDVLQRRLRGVSLPKKGSELAERVGASNEWAYVNVARGLQKCRKAITMRP